MASLGSYDPMLVTAARSLPSSALFQFETKWDGFRAGLVISRESSLLVSRNRIDMTSWFPELDGVAREVRSNDAILDGEIVCGDGSVHSFNKLLRIGRQRGRRLERFTITFVAFDALWLDGQDLRSRPIEARHAALLSAVNERNGLALSRVFDDGQMLFRLAELHGLEGVVAKRRGSLYVAGRNRDWLKWKTANAIAGHEWTGR